jgi:type 1 glutamine amidotransferase
MRRSFLCAIPIFFVCAGLSLPQPQINRGDRGEPRRKQLLAIGDVRTGFQHDSVSHALATIEHLGYESGTYDTYIRSDSQLLTKGPIVIHDDHGKPTGPRGINAKNLPTFDAIFFMGSGEGDLTAQQKADLLSFIHEDGKGFVAAHTGDDAFYTWPEFGEMVGGYFDNHPWGVFDAPVIVEDPAFPAMRAFPLSFTIKDEIYLHEAPYSREKLRVLARLDPSKLDLRTTRGGGVHRTDNDFPVAWAKMYGKGRVFYSTFGHARETWDNPAIQTMYFEAIKWAMGLTNADVTPRPLPVPSAHR